VATLGIPLALRLTIGPDSSSQNRGLRIMRYELTDRECVRKDETPGRDTTYNTVRLTEN
jgi:hypothetical protein